MKQTPEPTEVIIEWMDSVEHHELGITSVTVAEILYGDRNRQHSHIYL